MSERYTLSNRNKDNPKSQNPKSTSAKAGSAMGLPSIPPLYWVLLGVIVIVITNVATYFITTAVLGKKLSDAQAKSTELQHKLSQTETDLSKANGANANSPGTSTNPVAQDTKSKIQAIIDSKNYQSLLGLLGQDVTVSLAGSSTTQQTPQQVINSLGSLNGATGVWNWNLTSDQLKQLQQGGNAQYFGSNTVVGQSTNGYIVSVTINENGQITAVLISPSIQDASPTPSSSGTSE